MTEIPFNVDQSLRSIWEEEFDLVAHMPAVWQLIARRLVHAAELMYTVSETASQKYVEFILREANSGNLQDGVREMTEEEISLSLDMELSQVYFMLMGFAIENLAKGILVARNPSYVNAKGGLSKDIKTHDLVRLIELCGLKLDAAEKDILKSLTDFLKWTGRYPIPAKMDAQLPHKTFSGSWVQPGQASSKKDRPIINELFKRLWMIIQTERHSLKTRVI